MTTALPIASGALFNVPPEKQPALRTLLQTPVISWSVLLCITLVVGGIVSIDMLALRHQISLPMAAAINGVLMYFAFTVIHDSIHRSAARNQTLNDMLGRVILLVFAPHVGLGLFRWAHIQHHRFTNGPKDPDGWLHGSWWSLPFRFMLIDVGYMLFVIRKNDPVGIRHLRTTLWTTALTLATVAVLVWLGYGTEVLFLWFIPARIGHLTMGFVFFWLPHVKHDVPAEQDLTLATSVRLGHEWLMTPLCQAHNYHLIHHLFPSMPNHRHLRAWHLFEPELRRRNLQVQHGFAIQPTIHHGG